MQNYSNGAIFRVLAAGTLFLGAEPSQAQTVLPTNFDNCCQTLEQPTRFGAKKVFNKCTTSQLDEEYGSLFLTFTPPGSKNLAEAAPASRSQLRKALKALLRFTNPQVKSGAIDVTVTAVRPDGVRTLFHSQKLATFDFNETNGLSITTDVGNYANQIGPRFRIQDGYSFEISVGVKYSREQKSLVTTRVKQTTSAMSGLGLNYLPSLTSNALAPVAALEEEIAALFGINQPDLNKTSLTFDAGGYSAVHYTMRLDPGTDANGSLFVGLKRHVSIFPGNHGVVGSRVKFSIGDDTVRSQLIAGVLLKDKIAAIMTYSLYSGLTSTAPEVYQPACAALNNSLENDDFNLTSSDRALVKWAFAFKNPNIRLSDIRATDCASAFLIDAGRVQQGLDIPNVLLTLPTAYETARAQAQIAVSAGFDAAEAGETNAATAETKRLSPNAVKLSVPGLGSYTGEPVLVSVLPLGVLVRTDAASATDTYSGQFSPAGNSVVVSGSGSYVLGQNSQGATLATALGRGPIARYSGQLLNSVFNGYGRMEWVDGSFFVGLFSNDRPLHGILTLPDSTNYIGRFSNGKLSGRGVSTKGETVRWGNWVNGNLAVENPAN